MKVWLRRNILYIAFAQALLATLASLFSSEIAHLTPCVLCWFQRICMYPLVIILAVGIFKKDKYLPYYVLPLSIIGSGFALFHYLLQKKILPDELAPCSLNISCTTRYIEFFGFITIPFLSLCAFLLITVCMLYYLKHSSKE